MIGGNSDFVRVGQWTINVNHISSIRTLENNTHGRARVSLVSGEVVYLTEADLRTLEKAITLQQSNTRALMGR